MCPPAGGVFVGLPHVSLAHGRHGGSEGEDRGHHHVPEQCFVGEPDVESGFHDIVEGQDPGSDAADDCQLDRGLYH